MRGGPNPESGTAKPSRERRSSGQGLSIRRDLPTIQAGPDPNTRQSDSAEVGGNSPLRRPHRTRMPSKARGEAFPTRTNLVRTELHSARRRPTGPAFAFSEIPNRSTDRSPLSWWATMAAPALGYGSQSSQPPNAPAVRRTSDRSVSARHCRTPLPAKTGGTRREVPVP